METKLAATFPEQLAQRLRRQILSGQLPPGERLREEALARRYGISRGPIRDTFVRLTQEGLLEARPNAGVRVAEPPSPFKRATLVQMRRTIEANALGAWFASDDGDLLTVLQRNLRDYKKVCRKEALEDVVGLDMAFHRAIVESAEGGALLDLWLPVIGRIYLRYGRHQSLMESYAEHAAVLDAMQDGDKRAAVRLLRSHIV